MKRFTTLSMVLLMAVSGVAIAVPASPVAAAPTPVTVTPNALNGWVTLAEGTDFSASSAAFVAGPGTPVAGSGSITLTTGDNSGQLLVNGGFAGTRLDAIDALSMATYQPAGNAQLIQPSFQLGVDWNLNDAIVNFQGRLVGVILGPVTPDAWVTVDALDGGQVGWYGTGTPFNTLCTTASYCTWAQVLSNWPDAGIHALPGLGIVGAKAGRDAMGHNERSIDRYTIGISGGGTVYDFEPGTNTVVEVKPSTPNGFGYLVETPNTPALVAGAFVNGPTGNPAGTGSASFPINNTTVGGLLLGSTHHAGTPLNSITELSYAFQVSEPGVPAPSIQFGFDPNLFDADQSFQGRLVGIREPAVADDTWLGFDAIHGTDITWFFTRSPHRDLPLGCDISNTCTWAEVLQKYPFGGLHATNSLFGVKAGSGEAPGTRYVDYLTIGVLGQQTTYDFEAEVQCTAVCYVNAVTGNDAFGGTSPAVAKKTVQAAVTQVSTGGQVVVAAGTYTEQVRVSKDVTITGAGRGTTTIKAPAVLAANCQSAQWTTIVDICGSGVDVTMSDLAISGPTPDTNLTFGALVTDGATLNMSHAAVHEIRGSVPNGNQRGRAIQVGSNANGLTTTGAAVLDDVIVDTYQKSGVIAEGVGTTVTVRNSTITGNAANGAAIAQNGVTIIRGAGGLVEDNTITDNSCTIVGTCAGLNATWSAGVLVADFGASPAAVTVRDNIIDGNDAGVLTTGTGSVPLLIQGNTITDSVFAGIGLYDGFQGPATASILDNSITGSAHLGVDVYADSFAATADVRGNTVTGNRIGVRVDQTNGAGPDAVPTVNRNDLSGNTEDGIENLGAPSFDAECNWWGQATGPAAAGSGGLDGAADSSPWLLTSNLASACGAATLALDPTTLTVVEGDAGSTSATVTATLSQAVALDTEFTWSTAVGSATAGTDYTAVVSGTGTIPAGQTSVDISVDVTGDTGVEFDEDFSIVLGTIAAPPLVTLGADVAALVTIDDDDRATVSFANVSVPEGSTGDSTPVALAITLDKPLPVALPVAAITGADGTAKLLLGDWVNGLGTSAVIPAGATNVAIPGASVLGDFLDEPNETFTVGATVADPADFLVNEGTFTSTVTITDDDAAPQLTVGSATATEGNAGTTVMTFPVSLTNPSEAVINLTVTASPGTANLGSDFTAPATPLRFLPGETLKFVSVPVIGDTADEADETFTVTLGDIPPSVTVINNSATGTIVDDDGVTATVALTPASPVNEGNNGALTPARFRITLSQPASTSVRVAYATEDGTASAGSDYRSRSGVVTMAAGVTTTDVIVQVTGDTRDEDDETFDLSISVLGTGGNADTATATIADDDASPVVSISSKTVNEGNSGTTNMRFALSLNRASGREVTVIATASPGTATAGTDYTPTSVTVTFDPGETSQFVDVPVIGDTEVEPNETLSVMLSAPVNATLGSAVGSGVITNDDTSTSLSVTIQDRSIVEGNSGTKQITFKVTLNRAPTSTVTVGYTTSNGAATAGSDYTAKSGTLTFNAGQKSKNVTVTIIGDTTFEPSENFSVALQNPTGGLSLGSKNIGNGVIVNDD